MLFLRRMVFAIFLLAYLIGCPLTILYALGYAVGAGPEQGLVKTGLISLATVPSGASIYLEGRRYVKRTPAVLGGLRPGEYDVKVLLKNHQPWSRTVHVEAEQATVLEKILLLPKDPVAKVVLASSVQELIPIPQTRFLVLATGPTIDDLVVYDREAATSWPLLPEESPFRGSDVLSHVVVYGSPFLLLRVKSQEGEAYLGASLKNGRVSLADLTKLFPSKPQRVTWDSRWPHQLFSVQEGAVNRLDLEAMAIHPKVAERIRGAGVGDQTLCVLTEEAALQCLDREGKRVDLPFDADVTRETLSRSSGWFQIRVLSDELMLLLGERGELWVSRFPYQLVDRKVRGVDFDPQHQRLLIWRKDRVGILDCAPEALEESVADSGPDPLWVFQGGKDIQQAFWVYDASHVLFRDGDAVFLLELEPSAGIAPTTLLRVRAHSAVEYSEESGSLYYLDRSTGMLSFLELVQRTSLPRLPFSEDWMPASREAVTQ